MSGEQQPALSAQAEEDAMRGFYKELSGRWGKTLSLQTRSSSDSCTIDTLHSAAGARTPSGLKISPYTAFLYARKIIFREEVPPGRARKGNNAGTAADAPVRLKT
jgi:hypothetical protein